MPATAATKQAGSPHSLSSAKNLRSYYYIYDAESVAAGGGTAQIELKDVNQDGLLIQFRIACASENFNFSIRTEEDITIPPETIKEIFAYDEANKRYDISQMSVFFNSYSGNESLFIQFTNNDGVNAAGNIEIEFVIEKL